jgi:hypothetical protein
MGRSSLEHDRFSFCFSLVASLAIRLSRYVLVGRVGYRMGHDTTLVGDTVNLLHYHTHRCMLTTKGVSQHEGHLIEFYPFAYRIYAVRTCGRDAGWLDSSASLLIASVYPLDAVPYFGRQFMVVWESEM